MHTRDGMNESDAAEAERDRLHADYLRVARECSEAEEARNEAHAEIGRLTAENAALLAMSPGEQFATQVLREFGTGKCPTLGDCPDCGAPIQRLRGSVPDHEAGCPRNR